MKTKIEVIGVLCSVLLIFLALYVYVLLVGVTSPDRDENIILRSVSGTVRDKTIAFRPDKKPIYLIILFSDKGITEHIPVAKEMFGKLIDLGQMCEFVGSDEVYHSVSCTFKGE